MPTFPDALPPEGLDIIYKLLIYFGILYVLSTAVTSWLITRSRKSVKTKESSKSEQETTDALERMTFEDTRDNLISLQIDIEAAEAALKKLEQVKQENKLSDNAYQRLNKKYNSTVNRLTTKLNGMIRSDFEDETGEIVEGISDEEMSDLEADLEKQLEDLEKDDSFLRPRKKKDMEEIFEDEQSAGDTAPMSKTPTPSQPSESTPKSPSPPKAKAPTPPKTQESRPKAKAPTPPKTMESKQKSETPGQQKSPAPPTTQETKSKTEAPTPPSSSKAVPPPPPKKSTSTEDESKSKKPLSAAQPMKVKSESDEEGMFAKSTSIAALRMDMLRELARLKKLIPEDQENDNQ